MGLDPPPSEHVLEQESLNSRKYPERTLKHIKFPLLIAFVVVLMGLGTFFSVVSVPNFNCLRFSALQSEVCHVDTFVGPAYMEVEWPCPPPPGSCGDYVVSTCDQNGLNCVEVLNSSGRGEGFATWLCQNCYLQVQGPDIKNTTVSVMSPGNGVPFFIAGGALVPIGLYFKWHKKPKTLADVANEFS